MLQNAPELRSEILISKFYTTVLPALSLLITCRLNLQLRGCEPMWFAYYHLNRDRCSLSKHVLICPFHFSAYEPYVMMSSRSDISHDILLNTRNYVYVFICLSRCRGSVFCFFSFNAVQRHQQCFVINYLSKPKKATVTSLKSLRMAKRVKQHFIFNNSPKEI